jgi:hypothetical protein
MTKGHTKNAKTGNIILPQLEDIVAFGDENSSTALQVSGNTSLGNHRVVFAPIVAPVPPLNAEGFRNL